MSDARAHRTLQYSSWRHQADAALAGMWLFLGTEVLFFGTLFLTFLVCRHQHPAGFALAARQTDLASGIVNTVLLVSSGAVYAAGLLMIERRRRRGLLLALAVTAALASAFLVVKGFEWRADFARHLFPGASFGLQGDGSAQIFYAFYFVATGVHGLHMLAGLGLLAWLARRARRGAFDRGWTTPVEVVGLYWSFVDMVWLILFPLIYLLGRAG
jgi:cytochrome c oxidase subunit III